MDRDKRWDRTERSWRAIVDADGPRVATAEAAVRRCYERDECRDELLEPAVVGDGARVEDGDALIFFNFRPDRARQMTSAFMQEGFDGFAIARRPRLSAYVTMTDYQLRLPGVAIAFAQQPIVPLAAVLAERGLRQFHAAETEKYAHVTYFFNGGREEPYPGEDRALVPSQKVATYDLRPEMSAPEVAATFAKAMAGAAYDFAIVNFANPDMVGHTGSLPAAIKAVEMTDRGVGELLDALAKMGGRGVNTQHSTNPVPVVLIGTGLERARLRDGGLRDVAPTILGLLGIPVPERMTGRDLIERRS